MMAWFKSMINAPFFNNIPRHVHIIAEGTLDRPKTRPRRPVMDDCNCYLNKVLICGFEHPLVRQSSKRLNWEPLSYPMEQLLGIESTGCNGYSMEHNINGGSKFNLPATDTNSKDALTLADLGLKVCVRNLRPPAIMHKPFKLKNIHAN